MRIILIVTLLIIARCTANLVIMDATQDSNTIYWAQDSLPDVALESIFSRFDYFASKQDFVRVEQFMDEIECIREWHGIQPEKMEDHHIFRFKDPVTGNFCELRAFDNHVVRIQEFDDAKEFIRLRVFYRIYPYKIEIGTWSERNEKGELEEVNKDTEFPLMEVIGKVAKEYELPEYLLFHAELMHLEEQPSEECWKLVYHDFSREHTLYISATSGDLVKRELNTIPD